MINSVDQESLTPSYCETSPRRALSFLGRSSGAKLDKDAYESSCADYRLLQRAVYLSRSSLVGNSPKIQWTL